MSQRLVASSLDVKSAGVKPLVDGALPRASGLSAKRMCMLILVCICLMLTLLLFPLPSPLPSPSSRTQQREWLLHLVPNPLGVCLDGSAPGYYLRDGVGSGKNRWVVHLQGGGWCRSPEECLKRAKGYNPWRQPSLGGSGLWPRRAVCPDPSAPPCVGDGGDHGMLSSDRGINPDWADANAVFVAYCDGGSFSGQLAAPLNVSGVPVFARGRHVLEAVFEDLVLRTVGAKEILLKGASAGSQALLMHANHLAQLFRDGAATGAAVRVAPPLVSFLIDAGIFLDIPSLGGRNTMRPYTESWVVLHNASGSLPPQCTSQPPTGLNPPLCALSQQLLTHVDPALPLFISQFSADSAQISWVMGLRCGFGSPMAYPPHSIAQLERRMQQQAISPPTAVPVRKGATKTAVTASASPVPCNVRKAAYLKEFQDEMHKALAPVLLSQSPLHGAWVAECALHNAGNSDGGWALLEVQNQTQRDTVRAWYAQIAALTAQDKTSGESSHRPPSTALSRVTDGVWGANPTCKRYSAASMVAVQAEVTSQG